MEFTVKAEENTDYLHPTPDLSLSYRLHVSCLSLWNRENFPIHTASVPGIVVTCSARCSICQAFSQTQISCSRYLFRFSDWLRLGAKNYVFLCVIVALIKHYH